MNVTRLASEAPAHFDARVRSHVRELAAPGRMVVERNAATVYAEGVHAGLSIALACIQRRERIVDYLARWENEARARYQRENG